MDSGSGFGKVSLVILLIALRGRRTLMVRMAEMLTSSTSTQYSKTLRKKRQRRDIEMRMGIANNETNQINELGKQRQS